MIYAQFYHPSCLDGKPIEACGDRSVIILDGRQNRKTWKETAQTECKKRGYIGWSLYSGETFTRSTQISPLKLLND